VPRIRAQLLIHDASKDEHILAGWPAYETALKAAGVKYEHHVYQGEHGFNNDTTPRYDEAAARLAWQRTINFFRARLV
jgi:carboxymethylenebutenolidase